MGKVDINIALIRVIGAFKYTFKSRSGVTKECICIPIDALSLDKKGDVWLNMTGYDDTKYEGQTHSIKQKLSKAQYDALPTNEDGKKMLTPYLGTVRIAKGSPTPQERVITNIPQGEGDDLPF